MNYNKDFHYSIHLLMSQEREIQHVVDVGVSKYFYLQFWADVAESVTGFEPNPDAYEKIIEAFSDGYYDGRIEVSNSAVGKFDGVTTFYVNRVDQAFSVSEKAQVDVLNDIKKKFTAADWDDPFKVDIITLDSYFEDFDQRIDLIKSDTEHDELLVVEGAEDIILEHRPVLQLEHVRFTDRSKQACDEMMERLQYRQIMPYYQSDNNFFIPQEWNLNV